MSVCERWLWERADGTATRELTLWVDDTEVIKANASGRYAPKTVIKREVIPGRPGALTTNRRHEWRSYKLPLAARGASIDLLQQVLTQMAQDMDPLDGPGVLRHIGTDGHTCELVAVQTADLDPELWLGSTGPAGQLLSLVFESDSPYFRREVETDFAQGEDPTSWFGIGGTGYWVPIELGGSSVLGELTINTGSDALVWPVWTVVGPGDGDASFTNNRTGEVWSFNGPALAAGEVVTIDLTEGVKTITGPGDANWFPYLDQTELELWPFYKGDNPVTLTMGGATSASYIGWSYESLRLAP